MNILVIGSGGREHAIIRKLKESPLCENIYCAPGNAGIACDAVCCDVSAVDIKKMVEFAKEKAIALCVVTPDDPLVLGMVDAMENAGIPAFGPNKAAAIIEGSKAFSKKLMQDYKIPTSSYQVFEEFSKALDFVKSENSFPCVIKADGLAFGKGVIIAENLAEAETALDDMLCKNTFGASGSRVVIEEFLYGIEVSVLAFTDGETVVPMASSMDHKRALDGDLGLNTGGMGTISPHPLFDSDMSKRCMEEIFIPTMNAMISEKREFHGCLYFGLMLTKKGPRVIEYNCRFGDPETQVVLPLLEGDLVEILLSTRDKTLSKQKISIKAGNASCVVLASGGYPQEYKKGFTINGLDKNGQSEKAVVFHAGTTMANGEFLSNGGRVLGITCMGDTLKEALEKSYLAIEEISFSESFYRRDIGAKLV